MNEAGALTCPVCLAAGGDPFRTVAEVAYYRCRACGSLFAEPAFMARVALGEGQTYQQDYWLSEMNAARDRCFGSTPVRVAETLLYCRRPVRRFLDIGAGSGLLLDAMSGLMASARDVFHAVDAFPPPPPHRTAHPNFVEGRVADMTGPFDAGVCIEVIEHLSPTMLRGMIGELAGVSAQRALYYFNSGQPGFVEHEDPDYLDPKMRGHIVSYSLAGARAIFEPAGFNVIELPGRSWGFLAEFAPVEAVTWDDLYDRLWQVPPENRELLANPPYGPMLYAAGLESARCYLELAKGERLSDRAAKAARRGAERTATAQAGGHGVIDRVLTRLRR